MKRHLPWSLLIAALLVVWAATPAHAEPSPDGEPLATLPPPRAGFELKSILPKVYLPNPKHQYQGWNNCGPTTTAIALSNYGVMRTQTEAVNVLKPNPKDVNVSPYQIVDYVRAQGLDAQMRVNGTIDTLMWFLSNDIPVIVEQWLPEDGGMGHYRLATGYNRERQTMTFDDSYLGPDQRWTWEDWDARWSEFNPNHIFIPVYKPEQAALVRALLGPDASDSQMWQRAEANARQLIQDNPGEGRNWFALGDALLNQNRVEEAYQAYEKAYAVGLPFRYYWYQFGHFEAATKLGRWQRLIQLSEPVLARAPVHEEMFYYRGVAYQNMGNKAAARDAFMQSLDANRFFARPKVALDSLN
ncbi:MAG: C39 family peptidase [Anaerolineae bacterium]|nr:C39 family peptidase [Anaerolineae bacterium]